MTPYARILLALSETPNCSQSALATRLGASRRHVGRYLDVLEEAGYISVDRRNMCSRGYIYTVQLSAEEVTALRVLAESDDTW